MSDHPKEPTPEACSEHATFEWNGARCMAIWYPQMGGYVSRCVVVDEGGCFGAYIWHNGEFPFSEQHDPEIQPAYVHHCMAEQFIMFGQAVSGFVGNRAHEGMFENEPDSDSFKRGWKVVEDTQ